MRKIHHHPYWYYLLGKLLQGFLLLTYVFFAVCLLLAVFLNVAIGWTVLVMGFPWLLKLALIFGFGIGILSLLEALS
ncbi:hypothetical protein Lepto7375DRAFT_1323 [Leptolyngbya sp. PCC 7375]|nr:hypothetical protein Lepto7375DRAFT_1323 [Leptolyngbya sp. PCC 7375]